jgi:beta-lactam-binding protein with PASTA domain
LLKAKAEAVDVVGMRLDDVVRKLKDQKVLNVLQLK